MADASPSLLAKLLTMGKDIPDVMLGNGNYPYPPDIDDKMKKLAVMLGTGASQPMQAESSILRAFNDSVVAHNNNAAIKGYDGEPMPLIKSISEIDEHPSVPARASALEALASQHGWRVSQTGGAQTTASQYFNLRKPSGLKDNDGYPVDMNLTARVSDHGNSHGGNNINFAPGAHSFDEVGNMLSSAHLDDPLNPEEADVVFGDK